MTYKAGDNTIRECTPEEDDAAHTAAHRIGQIAHILGQIGAGYRFVLDIEAVQEEIDRQFKFIRRAARHDEDLLRRLHRDMARSVGHDYDPPKEQSDEAKDRTVDRDPEQTSPQ